MRHPLTAFGQIRADERMAYRSCLLLLCSWGAVYALLHFRLIDHRWIWTYDAVGMRARWLNSLLASPGNWLMATFGVKMLARMAGRPVSIEWAELAAFYLWMPWALMPIIDLVHGVSGIPIRTLPVLGTTHSVIMHAGWFVAFPCLLAQLIGLLGYLWQGHRWRWMKAMLGAVAILAIVRCVLEPIPEQMVGVLGRLGYSIDFWMECVWSTAFTLIWQVGWRLTYANMPRWVVVSGTVMAECQFLFWIYQRGFTL